MYITSHNFFITPCSSYATAVAKNIVSNSILGVNESGLDLLIRESYDLLGLKTFFTAGEKEVRAWTFKNGMKAPECAGVIHTDFEKGFIKAEVISYDDLISDGNLLNAKAKGHVRQEGKEYVFQDGDITVFKFNVTK